MRRFKYVNFELRQVGALPGLAIKFVIFYEVFARDALPVYTTDGCIC